MPSIPAFLVIDILLSDDVDIPLPDDIDVEIAADIDITAGSNT